MADETPLRRSDASCKRPASVAFGERLMTDVPECFNYGVFYDDGYDYMKHMKTMKEFLQDPNYVVENEEDAAVPDTYVPPVVEPVALDDPVDEEFEIPSDDELIAEEGELEDNFVELAGGKRVRLEEDEDNGLISDISKVSNSRPLPSTSNLPLHKVRMVERYLWGTEFSETALTSDDAASNRGSSVEVAAVRRGRNLTEGEELLEKQFDKLLHMTKSRNLYGENSVISSTSVMSDSLESAFQADKMMISKRRPQADDWNCHDSLLKTATLKSLEEMSEPDKDEDPLKDWVGKEKAITDITSSNRQVDITEQTKQPDVLPIPKRKINPKSEQINVSEDKTSLRSQDDKFDEARIPSVQVNLNHRMKGETAEEKRARKAALRAQKRERQQVKKLNKANFRREQMLQSQLAKSTVVNRGRIFVD